MAIEKWKRLSEKVVFEHPRIILVEDTVQLPGGQTTEYLRFRWGADVATIIAMRDDRRILLQREYSYPVDEVLYQFPGGSVPHGEDIQGGANRELMEESGFRGDLALLGSYYNDNRRTASKTFVFMATNLQEAHLPGDPEEFIEHEWHTEKEIDDLITRGQIKHAYMLATWNVFKHRSG